MFAGHIGAALALKRAEPRVNLGALVFGSLFLDFLLGIFVLFGVERVIVPENYSRLHYLRFEFPYSHSLLGILFWAMVASCTGYVWFRGKPWARRGAAVIGASVVLHFIGDVIEHPAQLPVARTGSTYLGLGLWNHLVWALVLEALLVASGMWLYLSATKTHRRGKRIGIVALFSILTLLAIAGQAASAVAPGPRANAAVWITNPLILGAVCWWLDSSPVSPVPAGQAAG